MLCKRASRSVLARRWLATSAAAEESGTSAAGGDPRTEVLEAALDHVGAKGWTVEALSAGAQECGLPSVAHGMFPRGAVELVDFFMLKGNGHLEERLSALDPATSEVDIIRAAIKERLTYMSPYVTSWPQAMALGALPQNASNTLSNLVIMADLISLHAGDRSTDINWYTKRAMVTSIYAATEVFMLTDTSYEFEDTWCALLCILLHANPLLTSSLLSQGVPR